MTIVDVYKSKYSNIVTRGNDLNLIKYNDTLFVGVDKYENTVVVLKSIEPNRSPIRQKTKMLSIECNVRVSYEIEESTFNDTVHIIKCFAESMKEREIFLELCALFISTINDQHQEELILEIFNVLSSFFANKSEPSDNELRGLFAELFTIWSYKDTLKLHKYWQSRDKMKFDFSISSKMKLEIKSTIKNERVHHFKHEQLISEIYDIYILSYILRMDDEGLSLYELMIKCKDLLDDDLSKLMKIDKVLKDTSENRLKDMKFSEEFLIDKRRFYKANKIPRFNEYSPEGVANAEYDCVLDNVDSISEVDFIAAFERESTT